MWTCPQQGLFSAQGGLEENVDDAEDPGSGPHSNRENGLESAVTSSKEPRDRKSVV